MTKDTPSPDKSKSPLSTLLVWTIGILLGATALLHYLTPQYRFLPPPLNALLSRHSAERILFILPIAIASFAFRQRGGLIALSLATCAMVPRAIWLSPSLADALLETAATLVVGCLVIWLAELQARERGLRHEAALRMRTYARQITQAQEAERQRIAHELHDETIQTLVVLSRHLEALSTLPEPLPEAAQKRLRTMQNLVAGTSTGLRRFVQDLRPPTLEHLGLVAAIEGLLETLPQEPRMRTELLTTGKARRLSPETELALFRIAQESLRNIGRHAGASQATIQLAFEPDKVVLTINDDGSGFDISGMANEFLSAGKMGLIGMEERAQALDGSLAIQSTPGRGTTVTAEIPAVPDPRTP